MTLSSDAYANTLLNGIFRGGGSLFLVLSTTTPGTNATNVTRPTDAGYSDTEVAATSATFEAAAEREIETAAAITGPLVTTTDTVVRGFGWALTQGGDPIEAGPVIPITIPIGSRARFPAGLIAGRA